MARDFARKLPLKKELSYIFNNLLCRDVVTSRMLREVVDRPVTTESGRAVYTINKHYFHWLEARPVAGENGLYEITRCVYGRHGRMSVSGDRVYSEYSIGRSTPDSQHGPYFTRDEALQVLRTQETEMAQRDGMRFVTPAPAAIRALSVHKKSAPAA